MVPQFRAPYADADETIAGRLLASTPRSEDAEARVDVRARRLVEAIRSHSGGLGGIEDFLHAYSLSTREGLALMVLAEALLRVPDAMTADALIEDKLAAGDWSHADRSGTFLVSASAWTLGITARVIQPGETPETIVESVVKRLGLPLTVNMVVHRANIGRIGGMVDLALGLTRRGDAPPHRATHRTGRPTGNRI